MQPSVSILIPAYNAERWIAATIGSALAQTWTNTEIIVVDDGSTDGTVSVARQFVPRIRVVPQANQGAAAARNHAFALSRGDYIQWLDADDLLAPDKIEQQIRRVGARDSRRILLSGAWGHFIYRPERAQFRRTQLWCDLSPAEWLFRKLNYNLHMQTGTWLVSRELTEAAGPWDRRLIGDDDGEYFCRVLCASEAIRFVPEAKVYYRRCGENSVSYVGRSNKKLDAQFLSMKLHIAYLRSLEDSVRVRAACARYLETWMVYFYPERPDLINEASQLAIALGQQVRSVKFSWKYQWIRTVFGPRVAKQVWLRAPEVKFAIARHWDKLMSQWRRTDP